MEKEIVRKMEIAICSVVSEMTVEKMLDRGESWQVDARGLVLPNHVDLREILTSVVQGTDYQVQDGCSPLVVVVARRIPQIKVSQSHNK